MSSQTSAPGGEVSTRTGPSPGVNPVCGGRLGGSAGRRSSGCFLPRLSRPTALSVTDTFARRAAPAPSQLAATTSVSTGW
jgi:hypothetical protein